MEYRRLGKTGLMISAVGLGGHWKGLEAVLGRPFQGSGYDQADFDNIHAPDFIANRHEVVSRAIELGVNYVDACSPQEVLAYSRALEGRRGAMHLGYSWHTREPRFPEWRSAGRLVEGLEESLAEAKLDAVDLWRISLPVDGIEDAGERRRIEEATAGALALAKRQGKARFTGVSSHDGAWLRRMIARYPEQIEVVLFPVPAGSKPVADESVFAAAQDRDTGILGIKPFGGGALFRGDGCDGWRARLAIRGILGNPLAATLPGCASVQQVTNAVAAVQEPRALDPEERAELERSVAAMQARVPSWLRNWQVP
jgi:aryl-alcohol dehydrogenase-like predicted oxidoreductase